MPRDTVRDVDRKYYRSLDPFVTLTAAAAATTSLRLGFGIMLLPQRDPITTAKAIASLDYVSGGRVEVGIGAGWNVPEIENHGTPFDKRFGVMRERAEAMKAIWTDDEASYRGRYVNFDTIMSWPKPVQKPHPPLWIGGVGGKVVGGGVRYGDGWVPETPLPARDPRRAGHGRRRPRRAHRRAAPARRGGRPRPHPRDGVRRAGRRRARRAVRRGGRRPRAVHAAVGRAVGGRAGGRRGGRARGPVPLSGRGPGAADGRDRGAQAIRRRPRRAARDGRRRRPAAPRPRRLRAGRRHALHRGRRRQAEGHDAAAASREHRGEPGGRAARRPLRGRLERAVVGARRRHGAAARPGRRGGAAGARAAGRALRPVPRGAAAGRRDRRGRRAVGRGVRLGVSAPRRGGEDPRTCRAPAASQVPVPTSRLSTSGCFLSKPYLTRSAATSPSVLRPLVSHGVSVSFCAAGGGIFV